MRKFPWELDGNDDNHLFEPELPAARVQPPPGFVPGPLDPVIHYVWQHEEPLTTAEEREEFFAARALLGHDLDHA